MIMLIICYDVVVFTKTSMYYEFFLKNGFCVNTNNSGIFFCFDINSLVVLLVFFFSCMTVSTIVSTIHVTRMVSRFATLTVSLYCTSCEPAHVFKGILYLY